MPAPIGNQFWKVRSSHGRKPIFSDPESLWSACEEYFDWVESNPLWEEKLFSYQGDIFRDSVHKMRPMTLSGLCLFLDMTQETWGQYRQKEGFSEVCKRADEVIYNQKFAGAVADMMNPSIIARDLGLKDKQEIGSDPENPIKTENKVIIEVVKAEKPNDT